MPNDMDREYNAWTGRKATALRRPKLDCGHPKVEDVHYHLWCDRLSCSTECADADHDCGEFKGKSGSEEEAEPVKAAPQEWASPELMATFDAAVIALDAATAGMPRSGITLADMEEASAAVRARREVRGRVEPDGPMHPGPGVFLPLGVVSFRPGSDQVTHWPDLSAPPVDAALEPWARCTCPRDPDDDVDPGDPLSTCPVHGWSTNRAAALDEQIPVAPWWRRMFRSDGS